MLPDYVDAKRQLKEGLTRWLRNRVQEHLGPFADLPAHQIFEGTAMAIGRPDGRQDVTQMKQFEAGLEITADEVPQMGLADIMRRIDGTAQKLADDMGKNIYGVASDAAQEAGNVVKAHGKITAEAILEVLEKIEIPFDDEGNPELPSIHIHPDMTETLKAALLSLREDPNLRTRHEELLQEKKEIWRDREASRRLVG